MPANTRAFILGAFFGIGLAVGAARVMIVINRYAEQERRGRHAQYRGVE